MKEKKLSYLAWPPLCTCLLCTLFPCGLHNYLLSYSPLFILNTLSLFSYCLAPLLRHSGLHFFLPLLSAFMVAACSPFASTQYLYCSGVRSFFAYIQYLY
jgi:hypothetical protein